MNPSFGFVYILTNDFMPNVYKVGCTERSPHARAEELSKPTGVPAPFRVLLYAEVEDFQGVERRMHRWLADYRVSNNREFFQGGLEFACRCLYWLPGRLSFVEPGEAGDLNALQHLAISGDISLDYKHWDQTVNPFFRDESPDPTEQDEAEFSDETEESK